MIQIQEGPVSGCGEREVHGAEPDSAGAGLAEAVRGEGVQSV